MKYKSILLFVLLVAIIASFNFISCHKYEPENDDYSDRRELTEVDLDVYFKAREAYLDDPANAADPEYSLIESFASKPSTVRTKVVEKGINYQFSSAMFVVTIYKGDSDEVGKVIEIEENMPSMITSSDIRARRMNCGRCGSSI